MIEQHRWSASVFLVAFAWGLSGNARADDPATEENYVKIRVNVEIRGIIRQTDKGLFLETKEEVQHVVPGSFAKKSPGSVEKKETESRWDLDPKDPKIAGKGVATLVGKTVVVTGLAELRQLSVKIHVSNAFAGRAGWYQFTTLEPQRKVTVGDVKVVNQK